MTWPTIRTRRLSRTEYERMIAAGVFPPGERIELLNGELVVREPQGSAHATAIRLTEDALRAAFAHGWDVRGQLPVALDDTSEPEPDVVVVAGSPRDYLAAHPSRPVLVVEVADASLAVDRTVKAALYARAAVGDYWIVNLVDRVLEVHREPVARARSPLGWDYSRVTALPVTDAITPLAAPSARVHVADLLP